MKKIVVALFFMFVAVSGFSQITGQAKRQIRMLNKEINISYAQVRQDIKSLKYFQQPKHYDSVAVKSLQRSIRFGEKRATVLSKRRDNIFDRATTYVGIPRELNSLNLKRRLRSLSVQERELFLRKVELTFSSDSSRTPGYRGVVKNEYYRNLTLKFVPVQGGEPKSVYLYSGQQLYLRLLPGVYSVTTQSGGMEGNTPYRLVVPAPTEANFGGEKVSWYIVIPRY